MPGVQRYLTISGASVTIAHALTRESEGVGGHEIPVPPAAAGTLTTRTDNQTGTLTMSDAGHGITTGAVIDLYWEGGARYGITVGTVSGTSVPIGADDSGHGNNLPVATTPITAMIPVPFNCAFDAAELTLLGMQLTFPINNLQTTGRVLFVDASDTDGDTIPLEAYVPRSYDVAGGDAHPFEGLDPIVSGIVSHGASTAAATFKLLWGQDVTP